eukprot:scaffold126539_cov14-Tisochrysis_lutea.AAC.3
MRFISKECASSSTRKCPRCSGTRPAPCKSYAQVAQGAGRVPEQLGPMHVDDDTHLKELRNPQQHAKANGVQQSA